MEESQNQTTCIFAKAYHYTTKYMSICVIHKVAYRCNRDRDDEQLDNLNEKLKMLEISKIPVWKSGSPIQDEEVSNSMNLDSIDEGYRSE